MIIKKSQAGKLAFILTLIAVTFSCKKEDDTTTKYWLLQLITLIQSEN